MAEEANEKEMSITEHLGDLRKVLIISLIAVAVTSSVMFGFFREQLLDFIMQPLIALGVPLVYLRITEAFFAQFKLCLLVGLILAMPIILYEIWYFIAPALKPNEKKLVRIVVPLAIILFFVGAVFAYFTILQVMIRFLVLFGGEELLPMLSIDLYISFLARVLVPFGLIFEMPIISYFVTKVGWLTPQWMIKNRKWAFLISFIVGAILTPSGDPLSQSLMALPIYLLYEISIIVAKVTTNRAKREGTEEIAA